ncbi:hypothetical protein PVAND_017280 [Polypedilum vanderplanki]|uniref:Zinc finger protein n=1 Tax=Polypedilum vanderplanki TaxID=319348 RepID=A0A9J6BHM3_POLVA|nr:hypothetical protein PVAND_017280 [Polypedilum vanderplanki]
MNLQENFNDNLIDHLNRCRFCLRSFDQNEKIVELDENIQIQFYELTQIELNISLDLSSAICLICHNNLLLFSSFRTELIEKQSKLLNHIQNLKENQNFQIKKEIIEDFTEVQLENTKICEDTKKSIEKLEQNYLNFICDLCNFSCAHKHKLETHMAKNHKKVFTCEICDQKFFKKFQLNAHMKAKHTEKIRNHFCPICNKAFFSAENLKKHVESHNDKDMPCEFCGKLFSCINNLRTHLYYHSEPKFVCEIDNCGKKFFMKKRLRAHIKTHKNQKDFVCGFCDKSYFSQNDLNRHISSIHQKLRFFCEIPGCNGNFSRREYYKKYALTHHQNLGSEKLENLLQKIKDAIPSQKS